MFGNATAGGAYTPGMSDYNIFIRERSKVFLGGPPLVKMATGEESDDESLGGAEMHARVSGLADYFAEDEPDALRLCRQVVRRLNWRKLGPGPSLLPVREPLYDADELAGIASIDLREPFDMREVIARIVDGSEYDEFKPLYGTSLTTGWAAIHGFPIGIIANVQGVLFSEEAQKATQFIQLCNQIDVPLLFIHNVTGYMVGREYEQRGIIKHGAQMINAVSNSTVPHIALIAGGSYGAGNYGMSGLAYEPRFVFTWPNAKIAVMGPQQLAGVLSIVARAAAKSRGQEYDEEADAKMREAVENQIESESLALPMSGRVFDDGIIDPARHARRAGDRVVGLPFQRDRREPRATACSGCDLRKLLVANRGEIARRVFRTARAMGLQTVAVYSDADADAPFVRDADEAVRIGGAAPSESYLRIDAIIGAAARTGADAIHPGYGFLAENAAFARACADAGVTFVGPTPEAIDAMGSKLAAKRMLADAGVPVLPDVEEPARAAEEVGLPAARQAIGGRWWQGDADRASGFGARWRGRRIAAGGGRRVRRRHAAARALRRVRPPRRDPDPRRHARRGDPSRRARVLDPAPPSEDPRGVAVGRSRRGAARADGRCGGRRRPRDRLRRRGHGRVLCSATTGQFYFLEVNTRLQVEHPVTEEVLGIDLVRAQLEIAAGGHVPAVPGRRAATRSRCGCMPKTRRRTSCPRPACSRTCDLPGGVRVDAGVESGSEISIHYDPMIAKVIAYAPTRTEAAGVLAARCARPRSTD